jgi:hypothetical protein
MEAFIRSKLPETLWTHHVIHREALASIYESYIEQGLKIVNVVNIMNYKLIVNFMKTRPLKARFLKKLCEDMGF